MDSCRSIVLVLGVFISLLWMAGTAAALGSGTQADPFRVHNLVMDASFVSQGRGYIYINGQQLTGNSETGGVMNWAAIQLQEGPNTIRIVSDIPCDICERITDCDCSCSGWGDFWNTCTKCSSYNDCNNCGFGVANDHVMAIFRVDGDNNDIFYTQQSGWNEGTGISVTEASHSNCIFGDRNNNGIRDLSLVGISPKCVYTGDCKTVSLTKTFFVQMCACNPGSQCCDGCNYITNMTAGSCSDGNLCTLDHCESGQCVPVQKDCSGIITGLNSQCNQGVCDSNSGSCVRNIMYGQSCNDSSSCTTNDVCSFTGVCSGTDICQSLVGGQCNNGACDAVHDRCIKVPANEEASCTGGICINGNCTKPQLAVSADLYPKIITTNTNDYAILSGNVKCLGAYCNYVTMYVVPSSFLQPNQYSCGPMNASESCSNNWSITGLSVGIYSMNISVSSNYASNQTGPLTLTVSLPAAGSISISSFGFTPSTVTAGSSTTASARISCNGASGAYCGSVTANISGPGGIFVPSTAYSCGSLYAGQECAPNWNVSASTTGSYNTTLTASSDRSGLVPVQSYSTLSVTNTPVGVIQIAPILSRSEIIKGDATTLGVTVSCTSSSSSSVVSCGLVKAYPRSNQTLISTSGTLTVLAQERNCGNMVSSSSPCSVYWNITGVTEGTYLLDVFANSTVVQSKISETRLLSVKKNLGALSIPSAGIVPSQINLSDTATLSATISCSSNYCGSVTVAPKIGDTVLGPSTVVSTFQGSRTCSSFPCYLQWSLTGNSAGSFSINVSAVSNESIYAFNMATINVVDPLRPSLGIAVSMPSAATVGQAVQTSSVITCYTKDCGQVAATLSWNSNGWKALSPSRNAYLPGSQQNPVVSTLNPGQSYTASWMINFTEPGNYELGLFATGTAANITNAQRIQIVVVSQAESLVMEVLSPSQNPVFHRGDFVTTRARLTRGWVAATGFSPSMVSLPDMINSRLYDDGTHSDDAAGDGIYGLAFMIPPAASGDYRLVLRQDQTEQIVYIKVDPALDVAVNTDKGSYSWGENIEISGSARKSGEMMTSGTVVIDLSSGTWKDRIRFNSTGAYSYLYENRFMPTTGGQLRITVIAGDAYGNSGYASKEVPVSQAETEPYSMRFTMTKYNYSRGETVPIILEISGEGVPQEANVTCRFLGSGFTLYKSGGVYTGSYNIPSDARIERPSLSCSLSGSNASEQTGISIEPMGLLVTVISPQISQNILPVISGKSTELKVAVLYPDNTPVQDAIIQIAVGEKRTNMTYAGTPGFYKSDVILMGSGLSNMRLEAQDLQGNYGENNVTLAVNTGEFNWWWLLLIPAGLVVLFFGWKMYRKSKEPPRIQIQEKIIRLPGERVREVQRVREVIYRPMRMPESARPTADPMARLREEIAGLEEKYSTMQHAKDLAEQQYYKRQIDESTFNKMMQSYEEKLIEIDAAIKEKKKRLYG
jgi:hypothetical protein